MVLPRLAALWLLAMGAASFGQAVAQAPPAVPALPDSERRTSYSISATTCACSVGFQLYGSGTDVDQWIEVWVAGTRYLSTDVSHGWALTSATGSLATIPRPITNAVLTFTAVQTGTIQIVGAERPRRLSQFSENRGVAARDLNQIITDLVAQNREQWDLLNRALHGLPGEVIGPLPSATSRAGGFLCFDGTGLVPLACGGGAGTGNVTGPNSSVNGHIALFVGTTGKILSDGGIPGTGTITGPVSSTNGGFAQWNGTTGLVLQDGPTVIPLANGGTNAALVASNGGLVYSTGSAFAVLAGTATAGQIPLSGSSAAPGWSTSTWPSTVTLNNLLYASASNVISGLATGNNGVLITSGGGVPSISSTLPTAVQSNITTLGTIGSGVWNGAAVPILFGGTGQSTAVAARAPAGLNIESLATPGDVNYTILTTDRGVAHTALSAARTDTLPAASAVNAGQHILITDLYGVATGGNTVTIQRAGADTVNGSTNAVINSARGGQDCVSDAISAWVCNPQGASAVAGVSGFNSRTGAVTPQADDYGQFNGVGGLNNCTITATVASSNLTVALKDRAGSDPTATSPCVIVFRNATATSGSTVSRTVSAALAFTANSGSTFGQSGATVPIRLWVVAIDNAGTVALGVYNASDGSTAIFPIDETAPQSSTACNACVNATSAGTYYSTAAQTNKSIKILGFMTWNGIATGGAWTAAPDVIQLMGAGVKRPGDIVQSKFLNDTTTFITASTTFVDCTGLSTTITPTSTTNPILVLAQINGGMDVTGFGSVTLTGNGRALDNGATAGSRILVTGYLAPYNTGGGASVPVTYLDFPGTNTSTTYKFQCVVFNGTGSMSINSTRTDTNSAAFARMSSTILLQELMR